MIISRSSRCPLSLYDVRVALARFRFICCLLVAAVCSAATAEREIAEWALRQGGRVMLDGNRTALEDISELPPGPIHISGLDLVGTIITPQDLARIRGLTELRELYLPGPTWTPFSDSPLDANDELKNLSELKNLKRLSFSLHFLSTYNVEDKGLAHLTALTGIEELRLAQSRVVKPNLAAFVHLRALDLSDSRFSDEGMKALASLQELRRLYLRNTSVTDEGLKHLSGLTSLEELDLYGVSVTDRGMESLRKLTAMRKLNLLGAELSDAAMDVVSGMTHLRELNLYRSHITNAGLAKLAALKELAALDVRYSRVTPTRCRRAARGVACMQDRIRRRRRGLFRGRRRPRSRRARTRRPLRNGCGRWAAKQNSTAQACGRSHWPPRE